MRKKSVRFINNKFTHFTFNDAEDYASGEIWQNVCTSFHN